MKKIIKIRPRKDRGKFEVDYRDHEQRRSRPLFDSEEDALAFAAEKRKELSQGAFLVDSDITLKEYATRWLETQQSQLAPRTYRSYVERLENHVLAVLGSLKVREIRRRHVKALLAAKQRGDHAPNSIRLIRAALSTLLSDAVDDEIIAANPCLGLGKKKGVQPGKLTKADREQKIRPMTREQRDAVLTAAWEEPRSAPIFEVMSKAGLRPGEALALKPGDVDWRTGTLRIERNLEADGSVKPIRPTKTYSCRAVDLTPSLVSVLKRHMTRLKEDALRRGSGDVEWLFANEANKPLDESKARKAFKRALKRAGLPDFRQYDLRHSYACLLLAEGAPITYVSQQMGHSNPSTTLRYYARWIPSKGRRWADVLDSSSANLEPKSGTKGGPRLVSAGAGGGTRTHDLLITNQLLCH